MADLIISTLFWIFAVLGAVFGVFGLILFISGATGKADPTAHGNSVASVFGFFMLVLGVAFGLFAWWAA